MRWAAAGVLNAVPTHTPRPSDSMSSPSAGHPCSPENMTSTDGRPATSRSYAALIRSRPADEPRSEPVSVASVDHPAHLPRPAGLILGQLMTSQERLPRL